MEYIADSPVRDDTSLLQIIIHLLSINTWIKDLERSMSPKCNHLEKMFSSWYLHSHGQQINSKLPFRLIYTLLFYFIFLFRFWGFISFLQWESSVQNSWKTPSLFLWKWLTKIQAICFFFKYKLFFF